MKPLTYTVPQIYPINYSDLRYFTNHRDLGVGNSPLSEKNASSTTEKKWGRKLARLRRPTRIGEVAASYLVVGEPPRRDEELDWGRNGEGFSGGEGSGDIKGFESAGGDEICPATFSCLRACSRHPRACTGGAPNFAFSAAPSLARWKRRNRPFLRVQRKQCFKERAG